MGQARSGSSGGTRKDPDFAMVDPVRSGCCCGQRRLKHHAGACAGRVRPGRSMPFGVTSRQAMAKTHRCLPSWCR